MSARIIVSMNNIQLVDTIGQMTNYRVAAGIVYAVAFFIILVIGSVDVFNRVDARLKVSGR
ncbi:hypothetical protein D3C71_1646010 [compost metagenome]